MSEQQSSCATPELKSDAVEYRDVPGFPGYRVGSDGTLWSYFKLAGGRETRRSILTDKPKKLSTRISGRARYPTVVLCRNGKTFTRSLHRVVLESFIGPRPDGMQARHFPDPSPLNNRLTNLSWGTPSQNNRDKEVQGTHQIGEKNPRAKLTVENVIEICKRLAMRESPNVIAKEFRVTVTLIRLIRDRKTWKHI